MLLVQIATPGDLGPADLFELYFREVSVVPSYSCGPDDTREALERIARREVRVADLVSHRYPVDRAAEAFERARSLDGVMKVAITF
jgi:L-iditol 2-dehydrogenase